MNQLLLRTYVRLSTARSTRLDRLDRHDRHPDRDAGQATTEYALVMLGAAAVALLVVTWATAGGGAGRIGRLFDRVIDAVLGRI
jgi:type VI protein secretion system component VasF